MSSPFFRSRGSGKRSSASTAVDGISSSNSTTTTTAIGFAATKEHEQQQCSSRLKEKLFHWFLLCNCAVVLLYYGVVFATKSDVAGRQASVSDEEEPVVEYHPLLSVMRKVPPNNDYDEMRKPTKVVLAEKTKVNTDHVIVGEDGGAWTAQTHLSVYGFNVDWGLMEVLEDACREIENTHNSQHDDDTNDSQWHQYRNGDNHILNGWWVAPKVVDAKVIEIGCGVGVYVDALKKEASKRKRKVFGIEPNPMGGTFDRPGGPKQLAVNLLEHGDTFEFAKSIRQKELQGDYFDLIYSIEVFEHMPLDRHEDAARFMAGLARPGTKLIFGAASPGQKGTGHIGNRKLTEWEHILKGVGFHKDEAATIKARRQMQEYNHKKNTQVYLFQGDNVEQK